MKRPGPWATRRTEGAVRPRWAEPRRETAMRTLGLMVVLGGMLIAPFGSVLSSADPQQGTCITDDEKVEALLVWAVALGTDTSQQYADERALWQVPATPVSEIELVSDARTCDEVRRGYNKGIGDAPGTQRDLYAVRVGSRYIAFDPTVKAGEFVVCIVLDQAFKFVDSIAS